MFTKEKWSKWIKNNQNKSNSFKKQSNRKKKLKRKNTSWILYIQNAILDRNQKNCVATNQSKYLWHFSWLILLHEWFVIIQKGHSSIFIRLHWIKLNELKIKSNNTQKHYTISAVCWGIFVYYLIANRNSLNIADDTVNFFMRNSNEHNKSRYIRLSAMIESYEFNIDDLLSLCRYFAVSLSLMLFRLSTFRFIQRWIWIHTLFASLYVCSIWIF